MLWMLDTNAVSDLLRAHPTVLRRASEHPMARLCMSAITEGELRYGLAKRPEATRLHEAVRQLLLRVQPLSWDSQAAAAYGLLRAQLQALGKPLSRWICRSPLMHWPQAQAWSAVIRPLIRCRA